jgi:predicted Zn-dependent peptidase
VIVGGIPTMLTGTENMLPVETANDALGGSFLSRMNMDLRESKHWSYGVRGGFRTLEFAAPYSLSAPVQADQTGPSIVALRSDIAGFLGAKPMTQVEFDRAIQGGIRSLSGNFETSGAVLSAMQANDLFKRPDNYYSTITARYRALTLPELNQAISRAIDPAKAIWVVVGNAATVKPQLDAIGLPVEVVPAASVASSPEAGAAPKAK